MFTFRPWYFLVFLLLLGIEILIALYAHDRFVRPYVGDYLVVILLYAFGRSFLKVSIGRLAIAVLLVSYLVEVLQYLEIMEALGLSKNKTAKTIIGYSFEWLDVLAYTLGILTAWMVDRWLIKKGR